jgi:hypothetical protein
MMPHKLSTIDTPSDQERLFADLDSRQVDDERGGWFTQVCGVYVDSWNTTWVQITAAHDPATSVVVHLSPAARANHVLAALRTWSAEPCATRSHVIEASGPQLEHR